MFYRAFATGVSVAVIAALSFANSAAQASPRWDEHHDHEWHRGYDPHVEHWRSGHWYNGHHEGRHGWWWIAGGVWYWYPKPIYPYPQPYAFPGVAPQEPAVAPPPQQSHCREFQDTIVVDGKKQKAYGTACLQPDGSWKVIDDR